MPTFASYDGTKIGYRVLGAGAPLVCLPGGPGRTCEAVERAEAGDESAETRRAYRPFYYGRWDDDARAHNEVGFSERARAVMANFRGEGAFKPAVTCSAIGQLSAPVLLYGGELDADPAPEALAAAARLFPNAMVTVQRGAGHFPWVDDPAFFAASVSAFLT